MATDPVVLQARLNAAETALHNLLIGTKAEQVDYDGRMVRYTKANIGTLQAYIFRLKTDLGQTPTPRRALGIRV